MEILVILVPLALMLGLAGLVGFLWSLRSGNMTISTGPPGGDRRRRSVAAGRACKALTLRRFR